jgi:hypothetical protein
LISAPFVVGEVSAWSLAHGAGAGEQVACPGVIADPAQGPS